MHFIFRFWPKCIPLYQYYYYVAERNPAQYFFKTKQKLLDRTCSFLNHSDSQQPRPVEIITFAHVVRPYVRTSVPLFKSSKRKQRKQYSLLAWRWAWPSGSLTTPVLFYCCVFKIIKCNYVKIIIYYEFLQIIKLLSASYFANMLKILSNAIATNECCACYWSTRLVVIPIFAQSVRPSVRPSQNFKIKQQSRDCGLAEWIIDDSCLILNLYLNAILIEMLEWRAACFSSGTKTFLLIRCCHSLSEFLLIHSANPVLITVFAHVVRPSALFKAKQSNRKQWVAIGETVGLAEWIIDDTWLVSSFFRIPKKM